MRLQELKQLNEAIVYKQDKAAARIERSKRGCILQYLPEYTEAQGSLQVAYRLPLQKEKFVFSGVNLPPFFCRCSSPSRNRRPQAEGFGFFRYSS